MNDYNVVKPERIALKNHPVLNERWVANQIAIDPSILNLGPLVVKDRERPQPQAGRLDLLLQDPESMRRYEIELQLGRTDESHVIRTIEYWDIERKRYPQYDHCAVIIAEDITARFLNVIGLFNGFIPLVAIQMSAIQFGGNLALVFTKVLDELTIGLVDDDEEVQEPTDRTYWENRSTKDIVAMADNVLAIVHDFDAGLELKYNKFYIGLANDGQPNNFVIFRARKSYLGMEVRMPETEEMRKKFELAGIDLGAYDNRWGRYRIQLTKDDLARNKQLVIEILKQAYDTSVS